MNRETVYSQKKIQINTRVRQLVLITGQRSDKVYPVAVGKSATPTPNGTYRIISKIVNPGGILGTRWMGLDIPNGPYGIHGTYRPESIGKAVSNGCIRMYNQDIEELFTMVSIGTVVEINALSANTGSGYRVYKVKSGDTLWKIARRFKISTDALAVLNGISEPDTLKVGQELKIPV